MDVLLNKMEGILPQCSGISNHRHVKKEKKLFLKSKHNCTVVLEDTTSRKLGKGHMGFLYYFLQCM